MKRDVRHGNVANRQIVLKLNKNCQAIDVCSVKKALSDLAAGTSIKALNLIYNEDSDGYPIGKPVGWVPTDMEEWLTLPVRPYDIPIHYCNGNKTMRVPTVVIAKNYDILRMKDFKGAPTLDVLWHRDRGIDQYTGKKLRREDASMDHIIPSDLGGTDEWENLALTHKDLNCEKGNRLNSEVGLRLIRQPKAPRPIPVSCLINEIRHIDWKTFLPHLDDEYELV